MTIPWTITGTPDQQAIVRSAFDKIKFPFERLVLPGSPECGWMDLNSGMFRMHDDHAHETDGGHSEGDKPEPLLGTIDGRRYILGVFYPGSARIYIDHALVSHPEVAESVVSAEIAHAVDEFLPLSDQQRSMIMSALHPQGADHIDTWWEKEDYSAEYYSLIGETFMILFTKAYSDIPFGNSADFVHSGENVSPEEIRSIIGIERTDAYDQRPDSFVRYGKSLVYHKPSHYPKKTTGSLITDLRGLRPCKVCKP